MSPVLSGWRSRKGLKKAFSKKEDEDLIEILETRFGRVPISMIEALSEIDDESVR